MATKFSQFAFGGAIAAGDQVVGLRNGIDTRFLAPALPVLPWTVVVVGQPLAVNEGYIMNNPVPAIYTLPTVAAVGQIIEIVSITHSTVQIAQNAGQVILIGNMPSTQGVGGSITSTAQGDSIILLCVLANSLFVSLGGTQGNWNIV